MVAFACISATYLCIKVAIMSLPAQHEQICTIALLFRRKLVMTFDVPKRLFATVPDYVAEALDERAKREGRSTSNLIAFILEKSVQQDVEQPEDDSAS